MKKKINLKKIIKSIVIMAIIAIVINLFFFIGDISEPTQRMNNLDYNVTLNQDGSMRVIETWDIYINKTNTIFKNFDLSSKFGEITDVSVKDLDKGRNLTQIYEEMYHVTTDCYYALNISSSKFEIAWGTGMENKRGNKRYQISYTITDVITDYKDCQELYWQFLSDDNAIQIKNVTGTINLPESVTNISDLRAWGHGPLNGNISIESNNCVKFDVDGLDAGRMLEVRVVTSDKMFDVSAQSKIRNYNYLSNIIEEETEWANEANFNILFTIFRTFIITVVVIINVLNIVNNILKLAYLEHL